MVGFGGEFCFSFLVGDGWGFALLFRFFFCFVLFWLFLFWVLFRWDFWVICYCLLHRVGIEIMGCG